VREGLFFALALGLSACASPRSASAPEDTAPADSGGAEAEGMDAPAEELALEEEDETVQLADEQGLALDALEDALRLANCDDAFGHRDAICDLSERICAIADEHPRAANRCEDAAARCANARERVSDECG